MSLIERLEDTRVSLVDFDVSSLILCESMDLGMLRGKLVEGYVDAWLDRVGVTFPSFSSVKKGRFSYVQKNHNVEVYEKNIRIHEFDQLFRFQSKPYIGEVKATGLNGFVSKINRAFWFANNFFDEESSLLVFVPFTKSTYVYDQLEEKYDLTFINSGYTKKQLRNVVNDLNYLL